MSITEDVRKYAKEKNLTEQEAIAQGLQEKAREFATAGNELYHQS
jgi:phosphomethylpyrimidine synthase